MNNMSKEEVVFVEFWPSPKRPLEPYEVITLVHEPPRGGRPGYDVYHWYDCAVANDGTLIYEMSGAGGLMNHEMFATHGPWWAKVGLPVKHNGQRRIKRLPARFHQWPPPGEKSVEARIVDCPTCGWIPDEGDDSDGVEICPHLEWSEEHFEWIQKGAKAKEKRWEVWIEAVEHYAVIVDAETEQEALERALDGDYRLDGLEYDWEVQSEKATHAIELEVKRT